MKILILGATGAVGQQVLQLCLSNSAISRVVAPTRRPLMIGSEDSEHSRLVNPIVDFNKLPANADWWQADACICCLGTTLKLAGSQSEFFRIDHDLVMAAARCCQAAGTPTFVYNSSLGAEATANNFYLKTKGEVEQHLSELGFYSLSLVRPSLLYGAQRPDFRLGERIGIVFALLLQWLIPTRYRAVHIKQVARCLLNQAQCPSQGLQVIESENIRK